MDNESASRRALVFGGSKGIGAAVVQALLDRGIGVSSSYEGKAVPTLLMAPRPSCPSLPFPHMKRLRVAPFCTVDDAARRARQFKAIGRMDEKSCQVRLSLIIPFHDTGKSIYLVVTVGIRVVSYQFSLGFS